MCHKTPLPTNITDLNWPTTPNLSPKAITSNLPLTNLATTITQNVASAAESKKLITFKGDWSKIEDILPGFLD